MASSALCCHTGPHYITLGGQFTSHQPAAASPDGALADCSAQTSGHKPLATSDTAADPTVGPHSASQGTSSLAAPAPTAISSSGRAQAHTPAVSEDVAGKVKSDGNEVASCGQSSCAASSPAAGVTPQPSQTRASSARGCPHRDSSHVADSSLAPPHISAHDNRSEMPNLEAAVRQGTGVTAGQSAGANHKRQAALLSTQAEVTAAPAVQGAASELAVLHNSQSSKSSPCAQEAQAPLLGGKSSKLLELDQALPCCLPSGSADSSFLAAAAFTGFKEGYVFKHGARGLGYYHDPPQGVGCETEHGPLVVPAGAAVPAGHALPEGTTTGVAQGQRDLNSSASEAPPLHQHALDAREERAKPQQGAAGGYYWGQALQYLDCSVQASCKVHPCTPHAPSHFVCPANEYTHIQDQRTQALWSCMQSLTDWLKGAWIALQVSAGKKIMLLARREGSKVRFSLRAGAGSAVDKAPWKVQWGGGASIENPHFQRVHYCDLLVGPCLWCLRPAH